MRWGPVAAGRRPGPPISSRTPSAEYPRGDRDPVTPGFFDQDPSRRGRSERPGEDEAPEIRMTNPLRYFAAGVDQPLMDDRAHIDRTYRKKRLSVMAAITIGYGIAYTCRLALSVVKKPLIDEGIFTAEELGIIGSGLFYSYAFGKLTNGFLADHSNIKKFYAFGVLSSAVMNLALGFSPALALALGGAVGGQRLVPGLRCAFGDRGPLAVVQQPRAGKVLRRMEHRPLPRRGAHLRGRRRDRGRLGMARRIHRSGASLYRGGLRHLRSDVRPPEDAGAAGGRGLE